MAHYEVHSFAELNRLLKQHMRSRDKRCQKAVVKSAKHMRAYIINHTLPIAFRTLEKSIQVEVKNGEVRIVADAPHAAAVEVGSRPHWAPLGPLVAWVKLRGLQGHSVLMDVMPSFGKRRSLRGTTTRQHAADIAGALDAAANNSEANDVNDPMKIAKAIQAGIAKHGTKPHWYMRQALPEAISNLDVQMRLAMEDNDSTNMGQGEGTRTSGDDRYGD